MKFNRGGGRGSHAPRGRGVGGGRGHGGGQMMRSSGSGPPRFNRGGGDINKFSNGGNFSFRGGRDRGGNRGKGGFRGFRGGNKGGGGFNKGPRDNFQASGQRRNEKTGPIKTKFEEEAEDDEGLSEEDTSDEMRGEEEPKGQASQSKHKKQQKSMKPATQSMHIVQKGGPIKTTFGSEDDDDEEEEEEDTSDEMSDEESDNEISDIRHENKQQSMSKADQAKKKQVTGKDAIDDEDDDEDTSEEDTSDEDVSDEMSDEVEEESDDQADEFDKKPQQLGKPDAQSALNAAKAKIEQMKKKIVAEEDEDDFSDEDMSDDTSEEDEESDDVVKIVNTEKSQKKIVKQTTKSDVAAKPSTSVAVLDTKAKKRSSSESSKDEPTNKRPKEVEAIKVDKSILTEEMERRKARDSCTLFVKNLPRKVSEEEIKSLSPDIKVVRRRSSNCRYGWLAFDTEKICEKNYKKLKNKKLCGENIMLDFCGEKSKNRLDRASSAVKKVNKKTPSEINPLELYIGNLPGPSSVDELKRSFPTAVKFKIPKIKKYGDKHYAFAIFSSEQSARDAFNKSKNLKIGGTSVIVTFTRQKSLA